MKLKKFRDLTLIDINDQQRLVITCDSAGGIGEKKYDQVQISPEVTGYFTASVAMIELLSYGADPITLVNTLAVEMDPTGEKIIEGIYRALDGLDFDKDNFITGTTEENIPVETTGMGITAIGIVNKENWKEPRSLAGDIILAAGLPKVGEEVKADGERTNMNIKRLLKIRDEEYIHEILPVGSKGIEYEIEEMARTSDLEFTIDRSSDVDLKKSAGPSTTVLLALEEKNISRLKGKLDIPINIVGRLK